MKWTEHETWVFLVWGEGRENGGRFPSRKCYQPSPVVLGEKELQDSAAPDVPSTPRSLTLMPPGFLSLRYPRTHFLYPPSSRARDLSYPCSLPVFSKSLPISPQAP